MQVLVSPTTRLPQRSGIGRSQKARMLASASPPLPAWEALAFPSSSPTAPLPMNLASPLLALQVCCLCISHARGFDLCASNWFGDALVHLGSRLGPVNFVRFLVDKESRTGISYRIRQAAAELPSSRHLPLRHLHGHAMFVKLRAGQM